MPASHPPEFWRRAVELARQPGSSVYQVAKGLGISEFRYAPLDPPG